MNIVNNNINTNINLNPKIRYIKISSKFIEKLKSENKKAISLRYCPWPCKEEVFISDLPITLK